MFLTSSMADSWLSSVYHYDMSSLYFFFSISIGFCAFFYSFMISLSLVWPFSFLSTGSIYLHYVTLHAIYMMFFFVMPFSIGGLSNLLIPLCFHVADMCLPSINNLSFWLLFFSFMFSMLSSMVSFGAASGWTLYPPYSSFPAAPSVSTDFIIFSLHLAGASSILSSINFVTTIFFLPVTFKFSFFQYPLFIVAQLVVAFLLIISLPVLAAAMTMLLFDSNFSTSFFSNFLGGDALLYQHLFWFFGHPEVYVLMLPAFAMISHVISFLMNSNTPFSYPGLSMAIISIGVLGCVVWAHHMFTSGMDLDTSFYFASATLIMAVPTGMKIFSWIFTFMSEVYVYNPLFMWTLGFMFLFTFGGLSGIVLSNCHLNLFFHDSYYVVAHFHYVLSLGAVIGVILSTFYLLNKSFNLTTSYHNQALIFCLFFLGSNLLFFPFHFLGLWGLPSHYFMYDLNFYLFSSTSLYSIILITLSMFYLIYSLNFKYEHNKFSYNCDLFNKYFNFSPMSHMSSSIKLIY